MMVLGGFRTLGLAWAQVIGALVSGTASSSTINHGLTVPSVWSSVSFALFERA